MPGNQYDPSSEPSQQQKQRWQQASSEPPRPAQPNTPHGPPPVQRQSAPSRGMPGRIRSVQSSPQENNRLILPGPDSDYPGRENSAGRIPYGSQNAQVTAHAQMPPVSFVPPSAARQTRPEREQAGLGLRQEDINPLLIGADVVLLVAIIIVSGVILFALVHGERLVLDRLPLLITELIIYSLCLFSGYLWGRYQTNIQAMQENKQLAEAVKQQNHNLLQLQQDNQRLRQEREALRQQVGQGLISSPPPVRASNPQERRAAIYENPKDPPDFEQEKNMFPHEKTKLLKLLDHWNVLAASRRGYGHAYEGKYREDDFALRVIGTSYPQTVLLALADGVSSKTYSRWGAHAAVRGAMSIADQDVTSLQAFLKRNVDGEECQRMAGTILLNSLTCALEAVQRYANEKNVPANELQTTLLVSLMTFINPTQVFVGSVQIGDGQLLSLSATQEKKMQWRFEQHPQIQGSGNEVQAFIGTNIGDWKQYLRYSFLSNPTFIMGMTDGVADDLESQPTSQGSPPEDSFVHIDEFQRAIVQEAASKPNVEQAFVEFLGYRKKQSLDDRTVICLYRKPGA